MTRSGPIVHDLRDRFILAVDRWFMGRRFPRPGRVADDPPAGGSGGRTAASAPAYPAEGIEPGPPDPRAGRLSARLMRVNHAGEVAAQALYLGQSMLARDPGVRRALDAAAAEERAHLDWCRRRLSELGARPSRLDPLWWAGSFAIGAAAGAAGDCIEPRVRRGNRTPGGGPSRPPSAATAPRRLPEPRDLPPHDGRRAPPRHPGGSGGRAPAPDSGPVHDAGGGRGDDRDGVSDLSPRLGPRPSPAGPRFARAFSFRKSRGPHPA